MVHKASDIKLYGFLYKWGYKESGAHLSGQFYSLNMKSGKISHCEQTQGNRKKENMMCFSSQQMITQMPRFVNRKKREMSGKKIQGTEPRGNMVDSVVDFITVYMQV